MAVEEEFILLSIGLAIIIIRICIRWRSVGPTKWQFDDYLMPFTGILFVVEVVAAYLVGAKFDGLTNSYLTTEQRVKMNTSSKEHYNRVWGSKIQVIGWSIYAAILWGLKVCITALYGRLTSGVSHLKMRVRCAYGILLVTYLGVALTILLSCQPFHHFWQVSPDPGRFCQPTNSPAYVLVVLIANASTDLYLLSIPLPLLWRVNITLRRRLTLMTLFSGALFILLAGTIRAVTILTSGPEGAVSGSLWACRETFVAIIVTNLPIIHPALRQLAKIIGLGTLLSKSSRSRSQSQSLKIGTGAAMKDQKSVNRVARTLSISISNEAAWASDEHILRSISRDRSPSINCVSGILVAQEVSIKSGRAVEKIVSKNPAQSRSDDWDGKGFVGKETHNSCICDTIAS